MASDVNVRSGENAFKDLFRAGVTDIWATVGPSLNGGSFKISEKSTETLIEILNAGAYGIRTNFCDGTRELQPEIASTVKAASVLADKPVVLIADLDGEKARLGGFPEKNICLSDGEKITLVSKKIEFDEKQRIIPVATDNFFERVSEGDKIIVGEGAATLKITRTCGDRVVCEALGMAVLNPLRGLFLYSSKPFQPSSMTKTDEKDLEFIASSGSFDVVELSFVSHQEEVVRAREILSKSTKHIPIISKIETRKGVENINEILGVSDGVMVARGDLALFAAHWSELGILVDRVVTAAQASGKNWIMATQLVSGLESFAFPTRAEICDLTHWIRSGASAVLLSDETAFGPKPVEAVYCVRQILNAVKRPGVPLESFVSAPAERPNALSIKNRSSLLA